MWVLPLLRLMAKVSDDAIVVGCIERAVEEPL